MSTAVDEYSCYGTRTTTRGVHEDRRCYASPGYRFVLGWPLTLTRFKEKEGRYACLCRRLICGVHLTVQTIRVRVGDSPHVTIDSVITEGSTIIWLVDRCLTGSLSSVHPSPSQWRACSPSIFLSRSSAKQYTIRAAYPPHTSRKHCRQLLS